MIKLIIIFAIIISIIIIYNIYPEYYEEKDNLYIINEIIKDFSKRKYNNIIITKEDFDSLEIDENYTLYYFPNECPDYKKDILIIEHTDIGERYYLPEKNSLIKVLKDKHEWTNNIKDFDYWFKNIKEN